MSEINTTQSIVSTQNDRKHSKPTYISFATLMLGFNAMQFVVLQQYTYFYETKVGLDITMMLFAGIFYTIWDMFNDPIVGHLSDKNYGFTRRWGKRFPWIFSGTIPLVFSLVFLFSPPSISLAQGWFTFFWFLIFLSVYDGLLSAIMVNYQALLPVKFRSKEERTIVGTFIHLFMMLGPFIGLIIVFSVVTEDPASFKTMSIFLAIFALISFLLSIPGLRESEELKETYFTRDVEVQPFFPEFFGNIKQSFQEKTFIVLVVVTVSITITSALIAVSTPYYVEYIYGISEDEELGKTVALVSLPFVATTILLIPLYFWIIKKIGHAKAFKYALMLSPIPLLLIFFAYLLGDTGSLPVVMLGAGLYGVAGGILVISRIPVQGDFFDSTAIKYQKRQEGMYLGLWNFFSRLVTVVMLGILAVIHKFTLFDPDKTTQSTQAKWGIMAHFGLIPALSLAIAGLIFWKFWDLTPEKMETIKPELEKLNI